MSGGSKELILNQNESENGTSESNAGDTLKKRINFCYVCNVQCTAEKNLIAHQSGRKHLKRQSSAAENTNIIAVKNVQKKTIECFTPSVPNENRLGRPKALDNKDSLSGIDNCANKIMNNSNRYTPRNERFQYDNSTYQNRYSRYHNSKYSYSNDFETEEYYNNLGPSGPYCTFPQRNAMYSANPGYSNHGFINNYHPNSEYNAPYVDNYFFDNKYPSYNNSRLVDLNRHKQSTNYSPEHSRQNYNSSTLETTRKAKGESNSLALENAKKINRKVYYEEKTSDSTKTAVSNKTLHKVCISNLNPTSSSTPDTDKDDQSHESSFQFSKNNDVSIDNKRLRSRSLSSSESSRGKRLKNKTEDQSLPLDSASEEQRIKEWTDSLLDTSQNNISRLIHPSKYKEKAAVNHLITKLSKSKRNENLTKLRSNSTDVTVGENEDVNTAVDIDSNEISIILDSKIMSNENTFEPIEVCTATVRKTKKNSKSLKDSDDSNNQNPKKASKGNGRSKESNIRASGKKSCGNGKGKRSGVIKRKNFSDNTSSKGKKQRVHSSECSENPGTISIIDLEELNKDSLIIENASIIGDTSVVKDTSIVKDTSHPPDNLKTTNPVAPSGTIASVKEELTVYSDVISIVSSVDANSQAVPNEGFEFDSDISVETLIQLFSSGSVKVKEEFNDPVMDAIKGISPDELINACSNQSFLNKESETTNPLGSKDISAPETSVDANDAVSLITLESTVSNVNSTPPVADNIPSSLISEDQNSPSLTNDGDISSNISEMRNLNLLDKTNVELPPRVNKLINQLQEISSQEEIVKNNLTEAKSKISEISFLLEEWKRKKKRLQEQEEDLRKQRNDIIKSLQNTVKTSNDENDVLKTSSAEEPLTTDQSTSNKIQNSSDNIEVDNTSEKSYHSSISVNSAEKSCLQKKNKTVILESDEIIVLPPPMKPDPPEIIIFDDKDESASETQMNSTNFKNESATNIIESKESTIFDVKKITAHRTIVNCLVVFENFLYSCSNDNTGKRFSLQDASLTVTYHHTSKNVTEIVVEKVQSEILVFTSCCTAKIISLFIASSGTKIKTFFLPCAVMSICKGWGRFYSGLADGSVNVYNWKYEERELVKTESPASRINTAHQGRLHVLIILSADGNIAIRDAETGLLIRCIKSFVKHPSWMTVYNDLTYLSSSDKSLIILDIMTGRVEKRLYLNNSTTGLAAYDDYIFTISYSGLINCFNKDSSHHDNKVYYGAGKNGLTCVHVYQDWVFTGNRKGNISLFQFDPRSTAACEFGKCDVIYGLKEDLEYHVEKDHLAKKGSAKCSWRGCGFYFPNNSIVKERLKHFKEHIYGWKNVSEV